MPHMPEARKTPPPAEPASDERILESRDLLGPRDDVLIRHEGRLYRLKRTRQGKLILTA